jgi:hypothetical protein
VELGGAEGPPCVAVALPVGLAVGGAAEQADRRSANAMIPTRARRPPSGPSIDTVCAIAGGTAIARQFGFGE